MGKDAVHHGSHSTGYCQMRLKRRTKTDWAGSGIGDAFKNNLDYYTRLPAQRLFYGLVKKAQVAVAKLTGTYSGPDFEPKVKPQLGPCYTSSPSHLAAWAAVGLTAFLEFKARVKEKILFTHLEDYLEDPASADDVPVDRKTYKRVAQVVTECVQTRLLLEDLSAVPSLFSVEIYRLFSASQQNLRFRTLPEIIRCVILYGDVLPDWRELELHPLTRALFRDLSAVCTPFFDELTKIEASEFPDLGRRWVRTLCTGLAKYLPLPEDKGGSKKTRKDRPGLEEPETQMDEEKVQRRFSNEGHGSANNEKFAPLDGPNPPSLFGGPPSKADIFDELPPPGKFEAMLRSGLSEFFGNKREEEPQLGDGAVDEETKKVFAAFSTAIENAAGQHSEWEDMRSDLVERALRVAPFHESPIEGSPGQGHELHIRLGEDLVADGEVFDRPVELSDNLVACDRLLEESRPISEALRRSLYPNIQEVPETQRFCTSGSLDPSRLALANFSSAVFKRCRIREKPERKGRPVLVIACDGSGSLDDDQMKMVKILAAGWLSATAKSDVQVLAGLYHSGHIRKGVSGPLVQWIYHPHKTPALSPRDACRCLVSLPDTGTGVQSDALSLAFIMEEAQRLAKGTMIYLILLSDTEWNRSFDTEKDGEEEVYAYFESAYEALPGKLHTTLVALGVSEETGFEDLLDKVITVSSEELEDYAAVAEKIGVYVASCVSERSRLVRRD
ncbi:MAG: hypothetical protein SWQ30_12720 [Thermodesulfobacteriota bacterium]|nr:hypothetical protein [Thermodesulfobacteriota bacterium]